jgi:excisionase family DNA binding protein
VGEDRTSSSRLSVYQAAEVLGVTVDAIRKRIARGTIPHERDEDGRVWVLLDADQDAASKVRDTDRLQSDSGALTSELRDRLHYVEGQLSEERQAHAEARRIIAGLVERIPPAIEAPRESPETVEEPSEGAEPRPYAGGPQEGAQPRPGAPWWRRWWPRS